jgi:hypothetical protein
VATAPVQNNRISLTRLVYSWNLRGNFGLKRESDSGALYASRISRRFTATTPEQPVAIQKMAKWKVIAAAVLSKLLIAVLLGVWVWPKRKPTVVFRPDQDPVAPQAAAVQSKQETLTNERDNDDDPGKGSGRPHTGPDPFSQIDVV